MAFYNAREKFSFYSITRFGFSLLWLLHMDIGQPWEMRDNGDLTGKYRTPAQSIIYWGKVPASRPAYIILVD